jgi:hypothetical protein
MLCLVLAKSESGWVGWVGRLVWVRTHHKESSRVRFGLVDRLVDLGPTKLGRVFWHNLSTRVWLSLLVVGLVSWLVGWLAGWLAGWLVVWLVNRLVGWLAGWLAGWLVDLGRARLGPVLSHNLSIQVKLSEVGLFGW